MDVIIKRRDALELQRVLDEVSHLAPDQHEDMMVFNKFKYASGKNFNRLDSVNDQTNARVHDILHEEDEGFMSCLREMKALAEEYSERDDSGAVIYANAERTKVSIPNGSMPLYEAGKEDLKIKHAAAFERQRLREQHASEYLDETVLVDLHQVAFESLPRSLGGVWMNAIAKMISGIPQDLI